MIKMEINAVIILNLEKVLLIIYLIVIDIKNGV